MSIPILSLCEADTIIIGQTMGKMLAPGSVVALFGAFGAGKTVFVRGLARGLGLDDTQVCSPTFSLLNEYRSEGAPVLCHFDMYRVTDEESLQATGYYDLLDTGAVLSIEWSENILHALPEHTYVVFIFPGPDENSREISIEGAQNAMPMQDAQGDSSPHSGGGLGL